MLLKDLWVHHVLPKLSPIDLSRFQCVSKWCLKLTKPFQHVIDYWKHVPTCKVVLKAALRGHLDIVKLMVKRLNYQLWNSGLAYAARGGHFHVIQFFIEQGATCWMWALEGAARGGHISLIEFFLDKGGLSHTNVNFALRGAARGGHQTLVQFIIDKGATHLNDALYCAARGGYTELVMFLISKGANDWIHGLYGARLKRRQELIEFFEKKINQ
jgi:ankyrin repeat protein